MLDLDAYRVNAAEIPQLTLHDWSNGEPVRFRRDPHASSQRALNQIYVHLVERLALPILGSLRTTPHQSVNITRSRCPGPKRSKPRLQRELTIKWALPDGAKATVTRTFQVTLGAEGSKPCTIVRLSSPRAQVTLFRTEELIENLPFSNQPGQDAINELIERFEELTAEYDFELKGALTEHELRELNQTSSNKKVSPVRVRTLVRVPKLTPTQHPDLLPAWALEGAKPEVLEAREVAIADLRSQLSKANQAWEANGAPSEAITRSLKGVYYRAQLLGDSLGSMVASQRIKQAEDSLNERRENLATFKHKVASATHLVNTRPQQYVTHMRRALSFGDRRLGRFHPDVLRAMDKFGLQLRLLGMIPEALRVQGEVLTRLTDLSTHTPSPADLLSSDRMPNPAYVKDQLKVTATKLPPPLAELVLPGVSQ